MSKIGIIGGTGLAALTELRKSRKTVVDTDFGRPSAEIISGLYGDREIVFLARHGIPHRIPPHRVNYRANIRAMKDAGADRIISVNAVGGISEKMSPGAIVVPDQIIDYTWSREQSFFSDDLDEVVHIDFSFPYSNSVRGTLCRAGASLSMEIIPRGTYGATQGPRLETAAEIKRMQQDGCDLVGMTGMPEAALARELEIEYASICLVVNWAAGKSDDLITMDDIHTNLDKGMELINQLLGQTVALL